MKGIQRDAFFDVVSPWYGCWLVVHFTHEISQKLPNGQDRKEAALYIHTLCSRKLRSPAKEVPQNTVPDIKIGETQSNRKSLSILNSMRRTRHKYISSFILRNASSFWKGLHQKQDEKCFAFSFWKRYGAGRSTNRGVSYATVRDAGVWYMMVYGYMFSGVMILQGWKTWIHMDMIWVWLG